MNDSCWQFEMKANITRLFYKVYIQYSVHKSHFVSLIISCVSLTTYQSMHTFLLLFCLASGQITKVTIYIWDSRRFARQQQQTDQHCVWYVLHIRWRLDHKWQSSTIRHSMLFCSASYHNQQHYCTSLLYIIHLEGWLVGSCH